MGAELFPADNQTDMTTLTVAFRHFANAPKNQLFSALYWFYRGRFYFVRLVMYLLNKMQGSI